MATVEESASASTAPPQAPPPSPQPRPVTAASALRTAADSVAVGVIAGFFTFLWLCSAANAIYIAARWAYGEAYPATVAAKEIAVFTSVVTGLLLHALTLMFLSLCWRCNVQAGEIGGGGGAENPQQGSQGRDGELARVPGGVVLLLVVLFFVILVGVLMGSREMVYCMFVVSSLIFCFFTSPAVIFAGGSATRGQTA